MFNFYLAIERPNGEKLEHEEIIIQFGEQLSIPITAFHMSRYIEKEDAFAYEVLNAMDQSLKMNDHTRLKPSNDSLHSFLVKNGVNGFLMLHRGLKTRSSC